MNLDAAKKLIVSLDMKDENSVLPFVETLGEEVSFYKVSYLRVFARGLKIVGELQDRGKKVFVDLKFWDVPETVDSNIRHVADLGASFATVHGNGAIIQAAHEAARGTDLKILAVTVLTNFDRDDVKILYGIDEPVEETVLKRAHFLLEMGCDGVISSPREAARLRRELRPEFLVVTPGIRIAGTSEDDHKRAGDPRRAIADGADYLVVGRPIYKADDPRAAALEHIGTIQHGLEDRSKSHLEDN